MGVHACGLTLSEALLRLLPLGVLLDVVLRILLGGLVVSCAADGGVRVEGLWRLLQRPQGGVTPGSSHQVGRRRSEWEARGRGERGGGADLLIHPSIHPFVHPLAHSPTDHGAGPVACAEEPVAMAAVLLLSWHLDLGQGRAEA